MIRSNKRQKEQQRTQKRQAKDARRAEKKQQKRDGVVPETQELSLEGLPPGTRFNADGTIMNLDPVFPTAAPKVPGSATAEVAPSTASSPSVRVSRG